MKQPPAPSKRVPPTDWSRITSSEDEWRQFCWRVGMRFTARATLRVRDDGASIAEAVNATIVAEAAEMLHDGAPAGLVADFVEDYSHARAHQMQLVASSLDAWRRIDEMPDDATGPRKKPRAPRQRSDARPARHGRATRSRTTP